jgi:hypothetical protein
LEMDGVVVYRVTSGSVVIRIRLAWSLDHNRRNMLSHPPIYYFDRI